MIKVGTTKQLEALNITLPTKVYDECSNLVTILDDSYGEERNVEADLGGYILILESISEFEELNQYSLDPLTDVFEDVNVIVSENATYFSILYLLSSDFAINIIVNEENIPTNILEKWRI